MKSVRPRHDKTDFRASSSEKGDTLILDSSWQEEPGSKVSVDRSLDVTPSSSRDILYPFK